MFWYSGINSQFEPFIFQFSIHFVSSVYNGACSQHWLNGKADKLQSLPCNLFNVLKETAAWQEWLSTGAQPSVTRGTPNKPVYFLGTTTTKVWLSQESAAFYLDFHQPFHSLDLRLTEGSSVLGTDVSSHCQVGRLICRLRKEWKSWCHYCSPLSHPPTASKGLHLKSLEH